jgi:hypothetical protein
MKYGSLEYQYAEPIARALAEHEGFSKWVLSKSKFSEDADARLLKNEMMLQRQTPTAEWWRFHFFMGCKNPCCSGGRETDIFAVFEAQDKRRFAMHLRSNSPKTGSTLRGCRKSGMRCGRNAGWIRLHRRS